MSDNALAHYTVSLPVIEEQTKKLAVVERDDKLQIPVFVGAFVFGFAFTAGESRTFAGFRRSYNSTADVTISPGGFYHRLTPSLATVYVSRDDELLALRFEEDEGEEPEEDLGEEEEPGEEEEKNEPSYSY